MVYVQASVALKGSAIGLVIGWLLLILAGCLLLPLCLSFFCGESTVEDFGIVCFFCGFWGSIFILAFSTKRPFQLYLREKFFLTILAWIVIAFFAALPFYLSRLSHSLSDAMFEVVSALTTTGLSLYHDSHYFSQGLRFWRIFLQWFGGFGIILMAVTLLPALKIGSGQLIFNEFSDRSERIMPRASQISSALMGLYVGGTALCAILLKIGNLTLADAIYYSMAAISTGGIIVADQPLILLSPYCKIVLIFTMILGGSTLLLIISTLRYNRKAYFQDDQIKGYYRALGLCSLLTIWWKWAYESMIDNVFMSVSALTTTGFALGTAYDGFLSILFLLSSYIGGCSGSTAGGIKIFRLQVLYRIAKNQLLGMLKPYGIFLTMYNQELVEPNMMINLISIIFFYVAGWFLMSLGLAAFGYTLLDSFSLAASAISNSGIPFSSLCDHLDQLSEGAKWLVIFGMLCGRFEFVNFLILFLMIFWKR